MQYVSVSPAGRGSYGQGHARACLVSAIPFTAVSSCFLIYMKMDLTLIQLVYVVILKCSCYMHCKHKGFRVLSTIPLTVE